MLVKLIFLLSALATASLQHSYQPAKASINAVQGVDFSGDPTGPEFRQKFAEFDAASLRCQQEHRKSCHERNMNTTLLRLRDGSIFFDAKLAVDADGSSYWKSLPRSRRGTNSPNTSLRYPMKGRPSIDPDHVPYIVIPGGAFPKTLKVTVGDVAVVVYEKRLAYAVVGDIGPANQIGEGSLLLHANLEHPACRTRNSAGQCITIINQSIDSGVMFFIFPETHCSLLEGLTPENINERIKEIASSRWHALKAKNHTSPATSAIVQCRNSRS